MSYLTQIQIAGLRNLHSISLPLSSKVNLFYGENGSGKTSVLEAISLIGHGRSFRSHKSKTLITHNESSLTVFAEIDGPDVKTKVGFNKNLNGKSLIKMDGQQVSSASILASHLPLQIINSDSFQLIEGSPLYRRRFLDWMVFHVKPDFIVLWKRFQRVIKQRNSLLRRDKIISKDLEPWDKEFVELSIEINRLRKEVFDGFFKIANTMVDEFSTENLELEMQYHPGWTSNVDLLEQLKQDFDRDKRDGYTHLGPHRADLKILVANKPASETLSRGQEKSVIVAFHIAQAKLYQEERKNSCVFLIDDLLAELDDSNLNKLIDWLYRLNGQIFVTAVSKTQLEKPWFDAETERKREFKLKDDEEIKLFHVKQGLIDQIEIN